MLENDTRNQHFLTQGEQRLNALNPQADPSNLRIYSFEVVDRENYWSCPILQQTFGTKSEPFQQSSLVRDVLIFVTKGHDCGCGTMQELIMFMYLSFRYVESMPPTGRRNLGGGMEDRRSYGEKRRRGENMLAGYQAVSALNFHQSDQLKSALRAVLEFLDDSNTAVLSKTQSAIDYLGFEVYVKTINDTYESTDHYTAFLPLSAGPPEQIPDTEVYNPSAGGEGKNAESVDFFDNLRTLKQLLSEFSEYIRSTNDPSTIAPDVVSLKSYVDAFRVFLEPADNTPPKKMPSAIPYGLTDKISRINWLSLPERLHNTALHIQALIKFFF